MTLQELSDWLGVIGWFTAGFWFIRQHLKLRADFPRINIHAELRQVASSGGNRIVEVIAEVENTGEVRHVFRDLTYGIRGSDLGLVGDNPAILGQVYLPIVVAKRRRFFPSSWEYSFVDAGQKSTYRHLILIPERVKLAQLKVVMSYDDEESDFHSATWHGQL